MSETGITSHLDPTQARLHVILVEPEIAGNTGAIGRTCVAVGASLWLVRPLGFSLDDSRRRRAGLDYWEHLAWRAVNQIDEVAEILGFDRLWLFTAKSSHVYSEARYREGDGLVFGPESRGLPGSLLQERADRTLRIPIFPAARSLNISSAVAIGAFEAARQIGFRM